MKKTLWQFFAKLVLLFFKSVHSLFFFLTCSLIDRCQMVTDTCKDNVSKFVWKPFKSPLSLRKWKCFGEASLFNLHHLYFINTIYSLKKCSVYGRSYCIYSPKSFRFFRKEFHYVRKINKYINHPLRVGLWPRAAFLRPLCSLSYKYFATHVKKIFINMASFVLRELVPI